MPASGDPYFVVNATRPRTATITPKTPSPSPGRHMRLSTYAVAQFPAAEFEGRRGGARRTVVRHSRRVDLKTFSGPSRAATGLSSGFVIGAESWSIAKSATLPSVPGPWAHFPLRTRKIRFYRADIFSRSACQFESTADAT